MTLKMIPVYKYYSILKMLTNAYEREILSEALKGATGNVAKAARMLGTTARIFTYRARKLGLDPKSYRA